MKTPPFEATLAVRKANPWLTALAALPILGALALVIASMATGTAFWIVAPHLLIAAGVLGYMNARRKPRARLEPTRVHASETELRVGARVIPRERVRRALYLPLRRLDHAMVRVERKHRPLPIEFAVRDEAEGRRMLRAMGLDAAQSVAGFWTLSRTMANRWTPFLGVLALMPLMFAIALAAPHAMPVITPIVMGLAMGLMLYPTRVEVGADGILMKWLGRRRFIPASDIAGAVQYEEGMGNNRYVGVKVMLKSGQEVKVPVGSRWSDDDAHALVERIREAVDIYKRGDVEASGALLDRGERAIGDWVRMLKSVGAGASATLRTAAMDSERLWHLLESPSAPPKHRAAAAIALATSDEDGARDRIRVAATAVAEPKLRVALEAASSDDEAKLEEAMEELAKEEEQRES